MVELPHLHIRKVLSKKFISTTKFALDFHLFSEGIFLAPCPSRTAHAKTISDRRLRRRP